MLSVTFSGETERENINHHILCKSFFEFLVHSKLRPKQLTLLAESPAKCRLPRRPALLPYRLWEC